LDTLAVNLCIVQHPGDPHALCFLDQARYLRYHLGRLGVPCRLSKNRLYRDQVNIVFGAHKGFDRNLADAFPCVILNLEQIGREGASLPPAYFELLASAPTFDYDAANQQAYRTPLAGPCVRFLDAPYLRQGRAPTALAQRPIDLLFFGSINDRRRRLIEQIEAAGCRVAMFDQVLYGPERDSIIAQARAVLNLHFYETGRLEQTRVSHCLSLGTPVISERKPDAAVPAEFESAVFWAPSDAVAPFVARTLAAADFHVEAERKLARFHGADALHGLRPLVQFLERVARDHAAARRKAPAPALRRLNLGSGKDYMTGWINVDILERSRPDLVLDLSRKVDLPLTLQSPTLGEVTLAPGSLEVIHANNVLEHVGDLPTLMTNALTLLADNGVLAVEVPYERARTAWQDPTHVRAMNENSWIYYTDWFWYLDWFDHRFAIAHFEYLDERLAVCERERAGFMRVLLRKVVTSLQERMTARSMRADFGPGLQDECPQAGPDQTAASARATQVAAPAALAACQA
jgi:SAM-dependent methyltransferase